MDSGLQALDSGFLASGTWIPNSKGWDPSSCSPDSIEQDFGFHQQKFPGFRIP